VTQSHLPARADRSRPSLKENERLRAGANNLGRLMETFIKKAGVPRITPKGMRHTAQSIGRVVVGDDKVMQERHGHSDVKPVVVPA
jgi:hypothetical protein